MSNSGPAKVTEARALLQQLAQERRRVVSDWRALILLRRATDLLPPDQRRWTETPADLRHVRRVLSRMVTSGDLRPLHPLRHTYAVTAPYADLGFIEEEEILTEANPYAAVAYLSALSFHGLTNQVPTNLQAITPRGGLQDILPLGTTAEEWWDVTPAKPQTPVRIERRRIDWYPIPAREYFGILEYRLHGYPARLTTPERTLIDGLRYPDLSGGIQNALQAWVNSRDVINISTVVDYANKLNITVLKQRIGFVLEQLGLSHPILQVWVRSSNRGGSSKLFASAPYSPTYSERWNLSINTPIEVLESAMP